MEDTLNADRGIIKMNTTWSKRSRKYDKTSRSKHLHWFSSLAKLKEASSSRVQGQPWLKPLLMRFTSVKQESTNAGNVLKVHDFRKQLWMNFFPVAWFIRPSWSERKAAAVWCTDEARFLMGSIFGFKSHFGSNVMPVKRCEKGQVTKTWPPKIVRHDFF